jgi:alpha-N-arabinofuranosidase
MRKLLFFVGGLLLAGALPAAQTLTLDTSKTKEPISPYIYGQFIEHLGKCVNGGLWAELLEDRKFYYPVTDTYDPWGVATDRQWDTGPYMYLKGSPWKVIAPRNTPVAGIVTMDTEHPYTGAQAPVIHLLPNGATGLSQDELEVTKGRDYTGHIILRGDTTSPVTVSFFVDDDSTSVQTETFNNLPADYQSFPLKFIAPATGKARLEISARGAGTFEIGTVSLMPADNLDGWRADTVALLKQLNAPIYRWPGGNFVSGYNWRDGVGVDRDKRPPRKNPAWKGVEPNDVGIHEYMDLMQKIGAEPYVSVNTGLGTVEDVAKEIEYCNGSTDTPMGKLRADNGHPAPYNVKWWAVGNEMFGNWQLGNMPLAQYVQKHNQVAQAMWAVDKNAKLVAVGSIDTADWDKTMFQVCSANMTLLSEHVYVKEKTDTVAHIAQLADQIKKVADVHRQLRASVPELQGKDIRIAMDEWNYWYGDYLYGELGVRYHLKDALGIARGYHEYFRNSDIYYMANYAQTVNVIGAIKTTQTAAAFDATALPQVLYRNHFGTIPMDIPTQPAGLDVSAAWTTDKKAITIAIVNPLTTADTLTVNLGSTAVKSEATQWLITGDDPNEYNEPGQPDKLTIQEKHLTLTNNTLEVPAFSVVMYRLDLP